ncbi:MAG: PSD1 domain-containing protein [Verrucomicrobia bacterium]|nr:PSD1 domain-containing protein [Verrucomicrobiota bacterium]
MSTKLKLLFGATAAPLAAFTVLLAPVRTTAAEVDVSKLPPAASKTVDFEKDIKPLLEGTCLKCHSGEKPKGKYSLETRTGMLKEGDEGPNVVPGNSAKSPLIHNVSRLVEDKEMPPEGKGDPLTKEQIGWLRAWIDQGAKWPEGVVLKAPPKPGAERESGEKAQAERPDPRGHWAFKAPVRQPEPEIKSPKLRKWVRNPIDRFIAARLEKEKLQPSPEADRVTLIRRLSLDLIGLPPTPAEVDAFVRDKSAEAYPKLVERLLDSPHYGERWGRHWLDLARYADTNGYEKDKERSIWPYRDYVIGALNRDLPFDQFTIEQLAGDLLPNPTLEQRIATGFLRNSMLNQEGGIEPEQFRIDAMIDRLDAVGRTWLGLTINCAQCHNHKYDPITMRDYYGIFAFLNNDDEPFLEVPTPEQQKKRDEVTAKVRELEDKAMADAKDAAEKLAAWEKEIADAAGDWSVLEPHEWHNFATKYEKQSDHSLLGGGDVQREAVTHVWIDTHLTSITGFRLEALLHPNLPYGGPGLMDKGSFLLKEFTCEVYASRGPTVTNQVKFKRALASREAPGFSITNVIDGNTEKGGWTTSLVPVDRNREDRAVFECEEPIAGFAGGTRLKFTVYQKSKEGGTQKESGLDCYSFGRFRISATTQPAPLKVDPLTSAQRTLFAKPAGQRTRDDTRELFYAFRLHDATFAEINKQITDSWTNWVYAPTTLVLQQRAEPRETRLFKRGDWQKPGDKVEAATPAILHPFLEGGPKNRLGFAQWLVDRRSPTTARVFVNRIWQAYFGQGLFTTPEDIGTRVEPPSHPELLDWLASEFIEPATPVKTLNRSIVKSGGESANEPFNGSTVQRFNDSTPWSLKHLHRLIVTSASYRQSSKVTPELLAKDPYNRLLARGPRFRVEGEVVQDITLAASGLLNPKIGGPSVRPPIPSSVGDTVYGGFNWPESTGEDRYRRGMYTFWKRSLPFPSMLAFDAPTAEGSCPRRVRSNTPLQALTTLNEKTYVEAAQALGLRVLKEGGPDNRTRAAYAFRLCTGRAPTDPELKKLLTFWDEQFKYFEERTGAAVNVAVPDLKNIPSDVNLHKVAAWAMVSRAILNLDETITKE